MPRRKTTKTFCNKTGLDVGVLELPAIVNELNRFLMPIAEAIANQTSFNKDWSKDGPWSG